MKWVVFLINLIRLDISDFDVILDIDWLLTYHVFLYYHS